MSSEYFQSYFTESSNVIGNLGTLVPEIELLAEGLVKCILEGGTIFWCGNGGSASDAQHLAAELIGRFKQDREPIASIALNTDTSILTAISNDFSFNDVFSRQVQALGKPGDFLIGISTSGSSKNIRQVIQVANQMKMSTALLTSEKCRELLSANEYSQTSVLMVPSKDTCHIQEAHIAIGQAICGYVERKLFP